MSAIQSAVNVIGGQTATANALGDGLKQAHVWNWVNKFQQAPAKYINRISELTNGRVTVDELLADHEKNAKGGAHE